MMVKFVVPIVLVFILSCKNNSSDPQSAAMAEKEEEPLPEGFAEFYQRFHSDSVYQMEHIVFPLEGLPDQADSTVISKGRYYWLAENWKIQKSIDFEMSEYVRQLLPLNRMMVEEHIIHKNGQFGMVRRFARMGDEWQLIYYAGMNRIGSEQ